MDLRASTPFGIKPQQPLFQVEADKIALKLQSLSRVELINLMGISQLTAEAVWQYYQAWEPAGKGAEGIGKAALWTYAGDVYKGLQAGTMSPSDAKWAQQHLLIASGLYGLVRPYDEIQAYRLEMKTRLTVGRRKSINDFWSENLAGRIEIQNADWLCNCCSDEYAKPILKHAIIPVITPVFFDTKPNGTIGTVPIYSKLMRGVFARWMIDNRLQTPEQLCSFTAHKYAYNTALSRPNFPAFSRPKMIPIKFN